MPLGIGRTWYHFKDPVRKNQVLLVNFSGKRKKYRGAVRKTPHSAPVLYSYQDVLTMTLHFSVCPSTVAVMVVLPAPTPVTVPSEAMVATEVFPMDQVTVLDVPDAFILKVSPIKMVKSSRLREIPVFVLVFVLVLVFVFVLVLPLFVLGRI